MNLVAAVLVLNLLLPQNLLPQAGNGASSSKEKAQAVQKMNETREIFVKALKENDGKSIFRMISDGGLTMEPDGPVYPKRILQKQFQKKSGVYCFFLDGPKCDSTSLRKLLLEKKISFGKAFASEENGRFYGNFELEILDPTTEMYPVSFQFSLAEKEFKLGYAGL